MECFDIVKLRQIKHKFHYSYFGTKAQEKWSEQQHKMLFNLDSLINFSVVFEYWSNKTCQKTPKYTFFIDKRFKKHKKEI